MNRRRTPQERERQFTKEDLESFFVVDLAKGRLFWRDTPCHRRSGREAGNRIPTHGKYYWTVKIKGQSFRRSRILFCMAHGRWPYPTVDHINGNSLDDRIGNLREATYAENARNRDSIPKRSGLPFGVRRTYKRYGARIRVGGRSVFIGAFATPEEARDAYVNKRAELYGAFAFGATK